jgi:hypothetical protein
MYRLTKSDGAELIITDGCCGVRKVFLSNDQSVSFESENDFIIFAGADTPTEYPASSFKRTVKKKKDAVEFLYENDHLKVTVNYSAENSAFFKRMSITPKKDLTINQVLTENAFCPSPLTRGGEGQPVLTAKDFFCGMEFPSAQNLIKDGCLKFLMCPIKTLKANETFVCPDISYGFGGFPNYIDKRKIRSKKPLSIYCDWALHDEAAGDGELNEELALSAAARLVDLRKKGINFDLYVMDDFWYKQGGGTYKEFDSKDFPNGIDKFRDTLKEYGITFGLWFDLNMIRVQPELPPEDFGSHKGATCFTQKSAHEMFESAVSFHLTKNNVKVLKIDFACFNCFETHHKNHMKVEPASKEPPIRLFIEMVERLRKLCPELMIIAYNGFYTLYDWIVSVHDKRTGHMMSPYWTIWLDYLYVGDPRPSEIPTQDINKSILYYQDAKVREFVDSMIPQDCIDDHGTIVGNSATLYYQGKLGLTDSLVMTVARGAKKFHYYGDAFMLDAEDEKFVKKCYDWFTETSGVEYKTRMFGNPVFAEPYGYVTTNGVSGYVSVVNPRRTKANITVPKDLLPALSNFKFEKVYADQKFVSECAGQGNALTVNLESDAVEVYRFTPSCSPEKRRFLLLDWNSEIELSNAKTVALSFFDEKDVPVRTPRGIPDGIVITADGKPLPPDRERLVPLDRERNIWSGVSWAHFFTDGKKLKIQNTEKKFYRIYYEIN